VTPSSIAPRLTLRRASPADIDPSSWFDPSAIGETMVFEIDGHEGPVAFVSPREDKGVVHFDAVVVDPERRGYGLGTEAVELAEAQFPGRTFVARIDPANGLHLYFWLRLGYRPARFAAGHEHLENAGDMITMIRDSSA
jgi:GNAT superfamily N-acetyltransferase